MRRAKGLATQLGRQRHAFGNVHRVVELIRGGMIGDVNEVHSWVDDDRGMPPVPAHLDYDLWIGPEKYRLYHSSFCPYGWRFWWDYGTDETGNLGCHILDIPFWALKLRAPTHVAAQGPPLDADRSPKSMHVTFNFPVDGDRPAVQRHWYHGISPIL